MTRWSKSLPWLALFVVITACGSKPGDLRRIKGTIAGLTGTGLVLQLNGGHDLTVAADATAFDFTDNGTWISEGANYSVTVSTPPANPTQTCSVSNGSGTVGSADVKNVAVSCTTNTYTVSGSVTGLIGLGLVLQLDDHQNNPQSLPVTGDTSGNASFTFPNPVESGASYAVTVTTSPMNPVEVCTVVNGAGTMTNSDISVTVTCSTSSYTVGGTVSGLQGSGLVLLLNGQNGLPVSDNGSFTFTTTPVASGADYAVTVGMYPANPAQGCTVGNGTGTVANANITNVAVTCASPSWTVSTLAGTAGQSGSADGMGSDAKFNAPNGVGVDSAGNVYVADTNNHTIRKITPNRVVSTLAGTAGQKGSSDSPALFNFPSSIAVDSSANVYVTDFWNSTIRKIVPSGVVSTLAGTAGQNGSTDGVGSDARFHFPSGVAVGVDGTVYVADYNNSTIRKIMTGAVVSTLAGAAGQSGSTDGTGTAARFSCPAGVAVDGSGNVYVADYGNHTIRKIAPNGMVSTLAGKAGEFGSSDGGGTYARFFLPAGVAADRSGNIYVAEYGNHTIRKITSGGDVTTIAGAAGHTGSTNGIGIEARFLGPSDVAVNGSGNIYVADTGNNTIRKITP